MVVVCSWCGRRDGKLACWVCGDTNTMLGRIRIGGLDRYVLICSDCRAAGPAAQCSVSHGICKSCEQLNFDIKEGAE